MLELKVFFSFFVKLTSSQCKGNFFCNFIVQFHLKACQDRNLSRKSILKGNFDTPVCAVVDVEFHPKLHFLTHQPNEPSGNNAYKAIPLFKCIKPMWHSKIRSAKLRVVSYRRLQLCIVWLDDSSLVTNYVKMGRNWPAMRHNAPYGVVQLWLLNGTLIINVFGISLFNCNAIDG